MLRKLKIFWKNFMKLFQEQERDVKVKVDRDDMYSVWHETVKEKLKSRKWNEMQPEELALIMYAYHHGERVDAPVLEQLVKEWPRFSDALDVLELCDFLKMTNFHYQLQIRGRVLGSVLKHVQDFKFRRKLEAEDLIKILRDAA